MATVDVTVTYKDDVILEIPDGESGSLFTQGKWLEDDIAISVPPTQSKAVTPNETSQSIFPDEGYLGMWCVTVNAIPNSYVIPSGTLSITENGTYDVKNYASANVSLPNFEDPFIQRLFSPTISCYTNDRVSKVGPGAFYGMKGITSVNFPSATSIGDHAFHSALISYISSPNVTYLGADAFNFCSYLKSVSFPKATYVPARCFVSCSSMTQAYFSVASLIYGSAFYRCGKLNSVIAPNVTKIYDYAFYSCGFLDVVDAPLVSTIQSSAFNMCWGLDSVSFPSVISIYDYAFSSAGVKNISFPICTFIGSHAFDTCKSLLTVSLPELTAINTATFRLCTSLSTVFAPKVSEIKETAFGSCYKLERCDFNSNTITTIQSYAFNGCSSLYQISSFPELMSINTQAFQYCSNLLSINAPKVNYIDTQAFDGCKKISFFSFSNLSYIGVRAFRNCYSLRSMYLLTSSVPVLSSYTAFASTPMSLSSYLGTFGSIFIKASLYNSFITDFMWSRYSSRFVSLTDAQIAAL